MRIQTSETLATPDAEMVLRALERSLHDVSVEVVRDGRQIRMRGLGPSQRTMNRNDIGVVEVDSENDFTVIRADITFLASALLGGVQQDDVVRSKLDRVLDRVKMELGTKSVRVEALPWVSDSVHETEGGLEPEAGRELVAEQEQDVEPEREDVAEQVDAFQPEEMVAFQPEEMVETPREEIVETEGQEELQQEHTGEPIVESVVEHVAESVSAVAEEPAVEVESVRESAVAKIEPEVTLQDVSSEKVVEVQEQPIAPVTDAPTQGVVTSAVAIEVAGPVANSSPSEKRLEIPMFQSFQTGERKPPRQWGLFATVACMLAAVAVFLAWPYLAGLIHDRLTPPSSVTDESTAGEATKPSVNTAPVQVSDANAAVERDAAIHNESDPRVWLENWADAMRGQNASAQASFYSDPVEHYALKSNVSNADVWLDKQKAIQNRAKSWTVNLEDVTLQPRPDESLRVRLTKHFVSRSDGGKESEQFVHSQLKLKKIDGQWKIVSEQNLASTE